MEKEIIECEREEFKAAINHNLNELKDMKIVITDKVTKA